MKIKMNRLALVATLTMISSTALVGCAKHHRVTDPSTGSVYYTKKVHHRDGAVRFKDATTGKEVNLQNAEVERISKREYRHGT